MSTPEVTNLNRQLSVCPLTRAGGHRTACSAIRDRLRLLEGPVDLSDAAVRSQLTEKRAAGLVGAQ